MRDTYFTTWSHEYYIDLNPKNPNIISIPIETFYIANISKK